MRVASALGLLGLMLCAAVSARASGELTGTYAGTVTCKLASGTASTRSLLAISQRGASDDGASLFAEIDGVRYAGRAANGDVALRHCGAINGQYGDPVRPLEKISYAIDPASGAPVIHLAERSELGPCEGTWTRIDASEPGISACSP